MQHTSWAISEGPPTTPAARRLRPPSCRQQCPAAAEESESSWMRVLAGITPTIWGCIPLHRSIDRPMHVCPLPDRAHASPRFARRPGTPRLQLMGLVGCVSSGSFGGGCCLEATRHRHRRLAFRCLLYLRHAATCNIPQSTGHSIHRAHSSATFESFRKQSAERGQGGEQDRA